MSDVKFNPEKVVPVFNQGSAIDFDEKSEALRRKWCDNAKHIICINAYPNGVTVSLHLGLNNGRRVEEECKHKFELRLKETRDIDLPAGRYFLLKEQFKESLRQKLLDVCSQKRLESAVVYFGVTHDPFFAFHKKFNVTTTCFELLEEFRPGLVVVQTRSPLVLSALPWLKALGERVVVNLGFESTCAQTITRYTPEQSKPRDRLLAADGLRAQGINVCLNVNPILPYGHFTKSAYEFAETLRRHADFVTFGSLADYSEETMLHKKLDKDGYSRILNSYSYRYVYMALGSLAEEKIGAKPHQYSEPEQLDMFVA